MIKAFKTENCTFEDYLGKIRKTLSERDLGKIVTVDSINNEVKVTFNKLGKSELVYSVEKTPNGFKCQHVSEKFALTHRALRKEMESKFSSVLEKLGATVELG